MNCSPLGTQRGPAGCREPWCQRAEPSSGGETFKRSRRRSHPSGRDRTI